MTPGAARSAVAPDGPATLYLHIGMPKAGAAWIRRALAHRRAGPGREAAGAALAGALARLAAGDIEVLTSENFRRLAPRKRRAPLALMGDGAVLFSALRVTRSDPPARPWFPPPASIYQGTGAQKTETPSPVANVPRPVSVVRRRRHVATALFDGSAA